MRVLVVIVALGVSFSSSADERDGGAAEGDSLGTLAQELRDVANRARAHPEPPPRLPGRGTSEWRVLRKTFARYCRRHPSDACRELMRGFAEPRRLDVWFSGDQLSVGINDFSDSWPQAFCEWEKEKWVISRVGWFSMWE